MFKCFFFSFCYKNDVMDELLYFINVVNFNGSTLTPSKPYREMGKQD